MVVELKTYNKQKGFVFNDRCRIARQLLFAKINCVNRIFVRWFNGLFIFCHQYYRILRCYCHNTGQGVKKTSAIKMNLPHSRPKKKAWNAAVGFLQEAILMRLPAALNTLL